MISRPTSLHEVLVAAGGTHSHHEADHGVAFMVKVFDPPQLLKRFGEDLHLRAKEAGLSRPTELGILLNDEKFRLMVNRRGVNLVSGKMGRSYLKCSTYELTQMMLGHCNVRSAMNDGKLSASSKIAREIACSLFPRLPFWRPPWDWLPAD